MAVAVLRHTGADGLMVGRAARGNPWLFAEIRARLDGRPWTPPTPAARCAVMRAHLGALHAHYGERAGVRIARKHAGWYLAKLAADAAARTRFNEIETAAGQLRFVDALAAWLLPDRAA
jgi:tRNA-dihydrouridine synthase B